MRLFMCVNYPMYNPAIGITKKIKSQIENFEKLGFQVTYSAYDDNGITIVSNGMVVDEMKWPQFIPQIVFTLIRKFCWLYEVNRFLKKRKEHYDVGFIRWGAVDKSFLKTLKILQKCCDKIIMDCHGYHKNYKGHTIKGIYIEKTTKWNSHKLKQYIDVCLTETKNTELFGIKAIPMDTGIDVDKYQPHTYLGNKNELHMVSVANELPYHGYDRIIRGVANYGDDRVFLHLVGKMTDSTRKLISELGIEGKVVLHGYKTGKELDDIYCQSNIGVGPLAPHRIGGKEGTGIKTKEYFAIGLPYFFAGQELLVPDDYPYVLKMKSDDSPIEVSKVICFYNRIKEDAELQNNMRSFARENFSWNKIFKKTLHAIEVNGF